MDCITHLKRFNERLNDFYVEHNTEDVITYPKMVTLTLTLKCNYRCRMCYQKNFSDEMDWRCVDNIKRVLPFVRTLQLFGGEPLLYPKIDDLFALAKDNACEIMLITNGSLLNAERRASILDHNVVQLKISMEAATQETYRFIRGGNLEGIWKNIEAIAKARRANGKSGPEIQINFVAMENNIRELPAFVKRASQAGVDSLLVLFMNCQNREELAERSLYFYQALSDACMAEALEIGNGAGVDVKIPGLFSENAQKELGVETDTTCHSPWKNCLIDVKGNMSFCCGGAGTLGNLIESGFDELWHNEKITFFRRRVNKEDQPFCCNTCRVKSRNFRDISFHIRNDELAAAMEERFSGKKMSI